MIKLIFLVLLLVGWVVGEEHVLLFNSNTRLADGRPQVTCKGEYCYMQPREFSCFRTTSDRPYRCSTRFYEQFGGGPNRIISDIFQDLKITCVEDDCSVEYYLDGSSPEMMLYQQYKQQNPRQHHGIVNAIIYSGIGPFICFFLFMVVLILVIRRIRKAKTR